MAASIGLAAARSGKKTLIAELNTTEKVPILFGKSPVGYQLQGVAENLYCLNIQPEPALREYGLMKLRIRAAYNVVFENEFMRKLLRLVPGMNELLLIGKAWHLEQERDRTGKPVWDCIVVDAPATGHGVSLLRLPHVILDAVDKGPLAEDASKIRDLLTDSRRTALNIVTLPEEMPYQESIELLRQTEQVLKMPLGFLLINQVWPELMDDRELEILNAYRDGHRGIHPADGAAECVRYMMGRRKLQEEYLEKLKLRFPLPVIEIPYIFHESFGRAAIEHIAFHLEKEIERHERR